MKDWNDRDRHVEPMTPALALRGVLYALGIELCVLAILIPIAYGLGWL